MFDNRLIDTYQPVIAGQSQRGYELRSFVSTSRQTSDLSH